MTAEGRTVDICVCTYRRPQLADTLKSLAALTLPVGWRARVIVADNDVEPSARSLVYALAADLALPVRYLHAPSRNISIARNACLDASGAPYVAFIDDDETAMPDWLGRLIECIDADDAAAALGPVRAVYGSQAPRWMAGGDFHSTYPVWVGDEIRTGYTCNVLLRTGAAGIAGRRFDLSRGQTGGEDTAFFAAVHRAGGRIAYAPEAWVEEIVSPERASFAWLAKRRFRMGQTHGRLLRDISDTAAARPGQMALACAKAGYCFAMAGLMAASPVRRNRNALRGILHVGAVAGLGGGRELRQYGAGAAAEGSRHAA